MLPHLATITDSPTALFGHDLADTGPSLASDLEHRAQLDWTAEVLSDTRYKAMARLVNAWEWLPGEGTGGENPHRHPEGWIPAGPDFNLQVIQGPATGEWFVVKCRAEHVTAKEFSARHLAIGITRSVPRRTQRNPHDHSRYEVPWLWLEPEELHCGGVAEDEAMALAFRWRSELAAAWAIEAEGWGDGNEILVSPDTIRAVRAAVDGDDGQAVLDEVLDRVMAWEQLGADAGE